MFISILIPLIDNIKSKQKNFFIFIIFSAILVVFFGILKYFFFSEIGFTSSGTKRALTANANIILLYPLCYILFYSEFFRRNQFYSILYIVVISIGIQLSGFRTGWLTFFFIIFMWFIYLKNKKKYIWVPIWCFSFFLVLLIIPIYIQFAPGTFLKDYSSRILDTFDMSNSTTLERLDKWEYSLSIVSDNPILGLGRFQIYTMHLDYENKQLSRKFPELNRATHNIIATKAVHEGLLGLCILIFFLFVVFYQFKKYGNYDKSYFNFLKIYMISILLYSMFETAFFNPIGKMLFSISMGFLNAKIIEFRNSYNTTSQF